MVYDIMNLSKIQEEVAMKRMKKMIAALSAAAMVATGGFTVQASGVQEDFTPSKEYAGRTLKLLLTYSKEKTVLYECLDEFTEKTGIDLDIQYMPLGDMRKQINIMVTGDSRPDVLDVDTTDTYAYSKMGILADITDKVTSEIDTSKYYQDALSFSMVDGKYYGLPFTSNNLCLYYNADLLKKAGIENPPSTWDELKEDCAKLKDIGVYGFAASAGQNTDTPFHFMPFIWQAGGESGEKTDIGSDAAKKALTFYQELIDAGYMPKEVATYNAADIANQFTAGNIAMMIDGPWRLNGVTADADFEFNTAVLPAGEGGTASILGGHNFAVIDNDNVDISWEFIKYMNSPEVMAKYSEAENYIPARQDVAENTEYFQSGPISTFVTMAADAKMKPVENFSKLNDIMVEEVQSVVIGSKTPEQSVADAGDAQKALK